MITVFLLRARDFCFVVHAETRAASKGNPVGNNMYQKEGVLIFHTHSAARAKLKMHKLFVPVFVHSEPGEQSS